MPNKIERIYQPEGPEFDPVKAQVIFVNEDGDQFIIRANREPEDGIEIRVIRALTVEGLIIIPKISNVITIK